MSSKTTAFPQTYQIQFGFHFDVTQRLLELARALPEDVYRAKIGYSHGSIHSTFVHLLGAGLFWRNMITDMPILELGPEDIAGIDALTAMLEIERKGWPELLATFDASTLVATFERETPWGPGVFTIWKTLQHVILHGMQHHAELARMLTEAGHSPGDMDFISYQAAW